MRPTLLAALVAATLAFSTSPGLSQDKKEAKKDTKIDATAQKQAAIDNIKKAELGKTTVVETDHFLIVSALPEAKAKALGAVLEKVVPTALKALKYDDTDTPWKGKLAVYFLPDNREFKSFIRTIVMRDPEGAHIDVRADAPFVVDPVKVAAKATEADQFANTAAVVAGAYLKAKGGTASIPEWLADGFGRVTALRAEGTGSKRYMAYKTNARNAVRGQFTLPDLWGESKLTNAEVLGNSVAEFFAYGPGAMKFLDLIGGFRPDDNGNTPSVAQAFEAAGWKDMAVLEASWRKWLATGK